MNRPTQMTQFLIAAVAGLLAVTGLATLTAPDGAASDAGTAERRPVERSSLLCPEPSTSDLAETTYTSFTPASTPGAHGTPTSGPSGPSGSAELRAAASVSGSGTDTVTGDDTTAKGDGKDTGAERAARTQGQEQERRR